MDALPVPWCMCWLRGWVNGLPAGAGGGPAFVILLLQGFPWVPGMEQSCWSAQWWKMCRVCSWDIEDALHSPESTASPNKKSLRFSLQDFTAWWASLDASLYLLHSSQALQMHPLSSATGGSYAPFLAWRKIKKAAQRVLVLLNVQTVFVHVYISY